MANSTLGGGSLRTTLDRDWSTTKLQAECSYRRAEEEDARGRRFSLYEEAPGFRLVPRRRRRMQDRETPSVYEEALGFRLGPRSRRRMKFNVGRVLVLNNLPARRR